MAVKRPWRDALRPVPGSLRLMALRWLLFVVTALPALGAVLAGFGDGVADRPYFTESPDPLPIVALARLIARLPGGVWGAAALAAIAGWLGVLVTTAGAVALFGSTAGGRPRVWRMVAEAGGRAFWAYLRVALCALVAAALGARVVAVLGARLMDHAATAHWTLEAQFFVQLARGAATVGWLTLVGVFAWWCRVILVADERRRVRRLWTVVPRLWRRRPVAALASHYLLALAALFAGSWTLFAWRQSAAGGAGWALAWLVVLAGLAYLWHWRLRAGRLLWSSPELLDLRAIPDAPWGLPGRLLGRLRRRGRGAPPAAAGG